VAKITLTRDGKVLQQMQLSKERVTIGRSPHNDIVINDLAISAEHAVIVTVLTDSYLEDLNSTNGTQINGQPLKKHFLQDKDVIELADYRLKYVSDGHADSRNADASAVKLARPRTAPADHGPHNPSHTVSDNKPAVIKVLTGVNAGKEIALSKVLTTVGRPGVQVAVITRNERGYSITHVEGDRCPLVNGQEIGTEACPMAHNDVIDMAGTRMAFLLNQQV
jgi:hypothetical protein